MTNTDYLQAVKDRVIRIFADSGIEAGDNFFQGKYGLYIEGSSACSLVYDSLIISKYGKSTLKRVREHLLNYANIRLLPYGIFFVFSLTELDIAVTADMEERDREAVLEKVSKLLNLADKTKNNSEAEALAAAIAAQKLLAKHNMTFADLNEEKTETIEHVYADVEGKKFKYLLASAVAEAYCCKSYVSGAKTVVFYGHKSDAVIARRVFLYLVSVCDRLARRRANEYRKTRGYADGIYNSFAKGFVAGVYSELKKSCTALALIVPTDVEKGYEEFSKNFRGSVNSHLPVYDKDSYFDGVAEGKSALNAQYITSENEGTKYDTGSVKLIGQTVEDIR